MSYRHQRPANGELPEHILMAAGGERVADCVLMTPSHWLVIVSQNRTSFRVGGEMLSFCQGFEYQLLKMLRPNSEPVECDLTWKWGLYPDNQIPMKLPEVVIWWLHWCPFKKEEIWAEMKGGRIKENTEENINATSQDVPEVTMGPGESLPHSSQKEPTYYDWLQTSRPPEQTW